MQIRDVFRTISGPITAISLSGNTVTVTVASTKGLKNGLLATVTGSGMTNVDGSYNITVLNTTQFSYTASTPSGTYSGSGATFAGGQVYRNISVTATTGITIKNLGGFLAGGFVANTNSSIRYLKIYDYFAGSVPASTDTPILTVALPGSASGNLELPDYIETTSGLGIRATTGVADNDNTNPSANDVIVNLWVG